MGTRYFTSKWAAFAYYYLARLRRYKVRRPIREETWVYGNVWSTWVVWVVWVD